MIKNGDCAKGFDIEACPAHGTRVDVEYNFGMQDACVFKYVCGCAVFTDFDGHKKTYFDSYGKAKGTALLETARMKQRASYY
jgi:hypothetical protein